MLMWTVSLMTVTLISHVSGHGKMIDPPGRNTVMNPNSDGRPAYKKACSNGVTNYSDKGMFCGGRGTQESNGGKCGACGDNYASAYPRPHDLGGKYANKATPVRAYMKEQLITVKVLVSASHKGSFQFRLCNKREADDPKGDVLTKCFSDPSQYKILKTEDDQTKFTGPTGAIDKSQIYSINLKLPADVTCTQGCSLQWWYEAGNNPEPTFQEHFVNCADVLIMTCEDYNSGNYADWCAYGPTPELLNCADEGQGTDDGGQGTDNNDNSGETDEGGEQDNSSNTDEGDNWGGNDNNDGSSNNNNNNNNDDNGGWNPAPVPPTKAPIEQTMTCEECYSHGDYDCDQCCTEKVGVLGTSPVYNQWCIDNCARGFCPSSHCKQGQKIMTKTSGCAFTKSAPAPFPGGGSDTPMSTTPQTCQECTQVGSLQCNNMCCEPELSFVYKSLNAAMLSDDQCTMMCAQNPHWCPATLCSRRYVITWSSTAGCSTKRGVKQVLRELIDLTKEKIKEEDQNDGGYPYKET